MNNADLLKYGYADGFYTCTCASCEEPFSGDKRARRCKQCATLQLNRIIKRNQNIINQLKGKP